jgi:lysine 2,3-aminomutase
VNDDPSVLEELFSRLYRAGIRPHYLHHPDRAAGNGAFRVSLNRGLALHRELLRRSPPVTYGGATPPYVIDLPNGAGKSPVDLLVASAHEQGPLGRRTRYRWVRPRGWDCVSSDASCEFWDLWER